MASYVLCLLALSSKLVSGLAFDHAQETQFAREDGQGWSPAPTNAPRYPMELLRRGLLARQQDYYASTILVGEDATCGWLSGVAGASYTCGPGGTCAFFPAQASTDLGAVACEYSGVFNARLACINSADYYATSGRCDDLCQANTFTLKCILSNAPYCNTAVWADVRVRDVYCATSSVSRTQTFYTTYPGQAIGGSFSALALDTSSTSVLPTTRSTSTTTSTFSSSTTTSSSPISSSTSPSPTPAPKSSTPVGAIVGGVLGGVAVVALIAFGIFFIRRRNRNTAAAAGGSSAQPNIHDQAPPPVYIPGGAGAEMDGGGVGKPPPVSEYGGYYAGGAAPKDGNAYQGNAYQGNSAGGFSADGSVRRESNISPISPQTQHTGPTVGSPHMSGRESYVSSTGYETYPSYPPPAAHEMPASIPEHR